MSLMNTVSNEIHVLEVVHVFPNMKCQTNPALAKNEMLQVIPRVNHKIYTYIDLCWSIQLRRGRFVNLRFLSDYYRSGAPRGIRYIRGVCRLVRELISRGVGVWRWGISFIRQTLYWCWEDVSGLIGILFCNIQTTGRIRMLRQISSRSNPMRD